MKAGAIVLVCLAVLVVLTCSMFYTVNETEQALLMYFGKPDPQIQGPGLHFKWPVVNTVQKYDRRLRVLVTTAITQAVKGETEKTEARSAQPAGPDGLRAAIPAGSGGRERPGRPAAKPGGNERAAAAAPHAREPAPEVHGDEREGVEIPLIILQAYVCWRITDPLKFYQAFRASVPEAERKLYSIASDGLSRVSLYTMDQLVSTDKDTVKLAGIEDEMRTYMTDQLQGRYGVVVERFGINRLALPSRNEQKVYERMQSKRKMHAQRYKAEGRRRADEIRANAEAEARDIESKAEAKKIETLGEADAKVAEIYRKAYTDKLEFYQFWKTLEAYKSIFKADTTLVISADNDLMKYFRMSAAVPSAVTAPGATDPAKPTRPKDPGKPGGPVKKSGG